MPILHVLDVPMLLLMQQCAGCGLVHSVPLSSLQLGVEHDSNLIVMPPCSGCGSQEFLNRTFDEAPEHLAEHRKKVNALAKHLKGVGQVHPSVKDAVQKETKVAKQIGDLVGAVEPIAGLPDLVMPDGVKLP